jgi:hypothetical protein
VHTTRFWYNLKLLSYCNILVIMDPNILRIVRLSNLFTLCVPDNLRLYQKRVVCTELDIYVFIKLSLLYFLWDIVLPMRHYTSYKTLYFLRDIVFPTRHCISYETLYFLWEIVHPMRFFLELLMYSLPSNILQSMRFYRRVQVH